MDLYIDVYHEYGTSSVMLSATKVHDSGLEEDGWAMCAYIALCDGRIRRRTILEATPPTCSLHGCDNK